MNTTLALTRSADHLGESIRQIDFMTSDVAKLSGDLSWLITDDDAFLASLEQYYQEVCRLADLGADPDEVSSAIRDYWDLSSKQIVLSKNKLSSANDPHWSLLSPADGQLRQLSRDITRLHREFVTWQTRRIARFADFMRTMAVVWEELALETPDEIYETVWTIRIAPLAYLRAMWTLLWSAVRHPLSDTVIELKTGRVLRND